MSLSLRPHIASLPVYTAGLPAQPGPDGRSFKLSSNENPYAPLAGVTAAVAEALEDMQVYPDPGNAEITAAVATRHGLAEESLAFGNGSVGVLATLLAATCQAGDEVIHPWRSFEAYPVAIQVTGATSVPVALQASGELDLQAMLDAITPATRALMVCTPNNPTGPSVSRADLVSFLSQVRDDVMVVLDEAYVEYVTDPDAVDGLEFLDAHPGVVSLRTFSKAYGMAGMRVGWMAAGDPAIARAVRSATMPFSVSRPAQAAVMAALALEHELVNQVRAVVAERDRVLAGLADMGVQVPDAQGNFVWFGVGEATDAWFDAFQVAGLSTRPFAGEGLRVSIGEPAANDRILQVVSQLATR